MSALSQSAGKTLAEVFLPAAEEIRGVLEPTGYRILVCIPKLDSQLRNGLYQPDERRALEETASLVAQVIALGPTAYQDPERFPQGAWCKPGDFIMMRAYSGTRFKRVGCPYEYRLINDDTVEAVLRDNDPTEVERV